MKFISHFRFPILLIVVLYIFHLTLKDFSSPYQKPISADAEAYYAYLPALFIYKDSQFGFIKDYQKKYYVENKTKDFLNEMPNGKKVNKTFPGAAILYLPFFLLAHFLALIFGLDADGYSNIYQYFFDFGYWFYLFIGSLYFVKLFEFLKFNVKAINWTLFTFIAGTNIFFYSVVDQSVTHILNFALINLVIYHSLKLNEAYELNIKSKAENRRLLFILFLLLLIGITRPTNVLIFLALVVFIPKISFYKSILTQFFSNFTWLWALALIGVIGSIPFLLWQWQTQNWVVYSYGEEGFDFTHPEIFNFLWSYTKGWFVYTPIAFFTLVMGLFYLFKHNWQQALLISFFYGLSIYIFSSWWCWYYGAGLSQRVMIDYYLILGYLMLISLKYLPKPGSILFITLSSVLIVFNIIQTFQVKQGIFPLGSPTKEIYWDNFLNLSKKAKVYEKVNWSLKEKIDINLSPISKNISGEPPQKKGNGFFISVNAHKHFSTNINVQFTQPTKKIVIGFEAYPHIKLTETRLVVFPTSEPNKQHPIFLKPFAHKNKATNMEFVIEFNQPYNAFSFYFWNAKSTESCDFSNLWIESY